MLTISATDLARNTREILDKVASRGETVAIERNHTLIAQIMPPQRTMTAAQVFDGLALPMLTRAQAKAWLNDSKEQGSKEQGSKEQGSNETFGEAVRDPWA
jgi:antitoxin (DNA-binding transcriptional repressor) of toxin-antitoxin stability system